MQSVFNFQFHCETFLLYELQVYHFLKQFLFLTKYPILPIIVEVFPVPAPAIIRFLFDLIL